MDGREIPVNTRQSGNVYGLFEAEVFNNGPVVVDVDLGRAIMAVWRERAGGSEAQAAAWYDVPLLALEGWTPQALVDDGRVDKVYALLVLQGGGA